MPLLDIGGLELNYDLQGKGECVVMLHGLGGTLHSFDPIVTQLAHDYRALRFDLRGFGKSSKPIDKPYSDQLWAEDIHKALQKLGISRAVLIGHSMAGRIVCNFAANYPEQTMAIVSVSATMWGSDPETAKQSREVAAKLPKVGMQLIIDTDRAYTQAKIKGAELEEAKKGTFANDPVAYALAMEPVAADFAGEVQLDFLNRITCPTLIAVGDTDSVPVLGAVEMSKKIKGSHLAIIPDCGHFVMKEKPRVLLAILTDFLSNALKAR